MIPCQMRYGTDHHRILYIALARLGILSIVRSKMILYKLSMQPNTLCVSLVRNFYFMTAFHYQFSKINYVINCLNSHLMLCQDKILHVINIALHKYVYNWVKIQHKFPIPFSDNLGQFNPDI